MKPWPYRKDGDPLPTFCGKCGRRLLPYAWGTSNVYLELACAGWLQPFFRHFMRGGLFWFRHYEFAVDKATWSQHDPWTGERQRYPFEFKR